MKYFYKKFLMKDFLLVPAACSLSFDILILYVTVIEGDHFSIGKCAQFSFFMVYIILFPYGVPGNGWHR